MGDAVFGETWSRPKGHPISETDAKSLMAGGLGQFHCEILASSCAPLYWWIPNLSAVNILNNGTVTFVRTPKRLFGITAAHVVRKYFADLDGQNVKLQLFNAVIDHLSVIDMNSRLDLATIEIADSIIKNLGKEISPVTMKAELGPISGRGIMFMGYPAELRIHNKPCLVGWSPFTVLGIAKNVTEEQITWVNDRENLVTADAAEQRVNFELGGISGGPLIAWFETKTFLAYHHLCGIITQAHNDLGYVVAKRTHWVRDDGTIGGPR
jgi:hypothetical protein